MTQAVSEGKLLWQPSLAQQSACRMADYVRFLADTRGLAFSEYAELYAWSTRELGEFWASIAEYFQVKLGTPAAPGPSGELPWAHWFEGATLNYAEHALRKRDEHVALVARNERGERRTWTRAELATDVARARAGLRRLGVGRGDRVAPPHGRRTA